MDVFKLIGHLIVKNKEANDAIDETTDKADKSGGKIRGAFGKIGGAALKLGKVVGAGLVSGSAAVAKLTKTAIDSYAEYEQLVGGVETLFKSSSDKVIKYANEAYKTAGLSANQYMETVTSFSASLLQSLHGDTAKSADVANKAIIDMSDNANKMGTDISMIQNAYQGFAKQNYTMLDNLKLGYGGTKEEMERLLKDAQKLSGQKFNLSSYADIVEAIHVIQQSMDISGYSVDELNKKLKNMSLTQSEVKKVAESMGISYDEAIKKIKEGSLTAKDAQVLLGTTAKEASSTIQGSIGMMKSSWQNLVTGMADETQDFDQLVTNFIESIGAVASNLLPRVKVALGGVVKLIQGLFPKLAEMLPDLVKDLLPGLLVAATSLVNALISAMPNILSDIETVIPLILDALNNITQALLEALPDLIDLFADFIINNAPMIIMALSEVVAQILTALPGLLWKLFNRVLELLDNLVEPIQEGSRKVVASLFAPFKPVVVFFKSTFEKVKNAIVTPLNTAKTKAATIFNSFKTTITNTINSAKQVVKNGLDAIKNFFSKLVLKFPKIKLPHFNISGSFSLNPPSMPKLGVEWYAKAMDNAMLLNSPTIFGAKDGNLLGGGEKGQEVVSGANTLMAMIRSAVSNENSQMNSQLDTIIAILLKYLVMIVDKSDTIVLNDGTLVGRIAPLIDAKLGEMNRMRARGN